jgi:hypothetical protein
MDYSAYGLAVPIIPGKPVLTEVYETGSPFLGYDTPGPLNNFH